MKTLYIDTSSSYLYSAIVNDETIIAEVKEELGHTLSEKALPEIVNLFTTSNLVAKDIDRIVVVDGPGSFTGIRIGITIAKVYAWSLNIPIVPISALEAMAISTETSELKVPLLDARRNYVYAAIYNKDNKVLMEPAHIELEKLKEILQDNLQNKNLEDNSEYIVITNDEIETMPGKRCAYDPDIAKIVKETLIKSAVNPHAVNPNYLKLTEAEESKLNDNHN